MGPRFAILFLSGISKFNVSALFTDNILKGNFLEWEILPAEGFEARFKRFQKRYSLESQAMLSNLKTYLRAIREGAHPQYFKAGFIHAEQKGVKAIDQKGAENKKPAQTRLYVFPEEGTKTLHLITVGDKSDQSADVNTASDFVKKLMRNVQ